MAKSKIYVFAAILMAIFVFTASVSALKMVDIKNLSKTNRDGKIEASISAIGEIEQSNLIITYMGRNPKYPSLEALKTSEDKFECSIMGDSYTCIRQGNNKVGFDVTEQFSIKVTETSLASSRACGRTLAADTLPCLLVQTNYEIEWKTPSDLMLGYYKVEFTATDEEGNIRADKNRFRSVKQKLPSLSTTEDVPTTSNTNSLPQPTISDQESNKNNNNGRLPIEPITLQELVLCQRILSDIIRGMHSLQSTGTSDIPSTMGDLNNDGIISLQDLVVFQQHYTNPGWCRSFFEPKLEVSS